MITDVPEFNVPPEFSPEQAVMVRLLRTAGVSDAEEVVRADLVGAAYFGAYLAPEIVRRATASLAQSYTMAADMLAELGLDAPDRDQKVG